MLKHHVAACLMATALVAAPALAQTNQPAAPGASAPAGQSTTVTQPAAPGASAPAGQGETITLQPKGSTTAAPAGGAAAPATTTTERAAAPMQGGDVQYITQNRPDLWRASKLEGVNVYNEQNEKVGDIREVLVNKDGQVEAVVIGVGGFLGIGERDVAVPFAALQWVQEDQPVAAAPGTAPGTVATAPVTPRDTTAPPPAATDGRTATAPAARDDATMTTGAVDGRAEDTQYDRRRDYPERAILAGATKEQLKEAPEFRFSR